MVLALLAAIALDSLSKAPTAPMRHLPVCALTGANAVASSLAELPSGAVAELQRFFGPAHGLADAGQDYNATDVTDDPNRPWRRFLRAYRVGESWIVWYEHGGIAHHSQVIALRLSNGSGAGTYSMIPGSNLNGDLCSASEAILKGVRAADM